jgi:hypothetical protein
MHVYVCRERQRTHLSLLVFAFGFLFVSSATPPRRPPPAHAGGSGAVSATPHARYLSLSDEQPPPTRPRTPHVTAPKTKKQARCCAASSSFIQPQASGQPSARTACALEISLRSCLSLSLCSTRHANTKRITHLHLSLVGSRWAERGALLLCALHDKSCELCCVLCSQARKGAPAASRTAHCYLHLHTLRRLQHCATALLAILRPLQLPAAGPRPRRTSSRSEI